MKKNRYLTDELSVLSKNLRDYTSNIEDFMSRGPQFDAIAFESLSLDCKAAGNFAAQIADILKKIKI